MSPEPPANPQPPDQRILNGLACHRCKYILRNCALTANCPECGMLVSESLNAAIDLESPRSGPLPWPRLAGFSVILVAACAVVLPAITLIGAVLSEVAGTASTLSLPETLALLEWIGGLSAATGTLAFAALLFATGKGEFKPLWAVAFGYLGFLGGIPASMWLPTLTTYPAAFGIAAVPSVASLLPTLALAINLDMVLRTLGRRSLRFQRADGARQPASPIAWAVVIQLLSLVVGCITASHVGTLETVGSIARGLWLVSGAMVVVGFMYFFVNAIWASIPLRNASHRLGQILDVPGE